MALPSASAGLSLDGSLDYAFMGQLLAPPDAADGSWDVVDSMPQLGAGRADSMPWLGAVPGRALSPSATEAALLFPPVVAPLRCLDSTHAAACASCTTAPGAQFASWKLVGLESPKTLRSQILLTNEWNDREQRLASAAVCESRAKEGGGVKDASNWQTLAIALRGRAASSLTKVHLLQLCHLWNYKSALWTKKGVAGSSGTRRRKATAAADEAAEESKKAPRSASLADNAAALVPRSLRPTAISQREEMEALMARMSERYAPR